MGVKASKMDKVIFWDGEGKHVSGVEGIEVDGKEWTLEQVQALVRFAVRTQYDTLDSILRDRKLITVEELRPYKMNEELERGCRLVTLGSPFLLAQVFGLELSGELMGEIRDNVEFRARLRVWMQRLGDRIVAAWERGEPLDRKERENASRW